MRLSFPFAHPVAHRVTPGSSVAPELAFLWFPERSGTSLLDWPSGNNRQKESVSGRRISDYPPSGCGRANRLGQSTRSAGPDRKAFPVCGAAEFQACREPKEEAMANVREILAVKGP